MSLLDKASLILTPNAYKASKLYSIIPSNGNGDMTVVRNTSATRDNSSGLVELVGNNVPRLEYDGSCPTILLEPQRTNLALQSSQIGTIPWSTNQFTTIVQNSSTSLSPDNTNNATYVTNTGQFGGVKQSSIPLVVGNIYTVSVWVKADTSTNLLNFWNESGIQTSLGTFTPTNSWVRYSATFTAISSTNTINFGQDRTANSAGRGSIWIWGAQVERGSYLTSYIPTTTTALTRNADVLSRNDIYTNGLITAAGGTWFVELNNNFSLVRDTAEFGLFLGDSAVSPINSLNIRTTGTGRLTINKRIANAFTDLFLTLTNTVKIAIKWDGVTADVFVNGTKVVTATAFTTKVMEFLNLSGLGTQKYIKSIMLFPAQLTDTECTNLTTL